ncbi:MAG: fumarylacetoacetase [Flavobacteriales bacterium]|nr:fumarylacetoacetase [Flavobacteriales bacterium]
MLPEPANDPGLRAWCDIPTSTDFPIQNLPFGVFSTADRSARTATRIGDQVVDLSALAELGLLNDLPHSQEAYATDSLNPLLRSGRPGITSLRRRLSEILRKDGPWDKDRDLITRKAFLPVASATMHVPVKIGDYTDFYSSREHATNVGSMFRDPKNALLPNWLHLPVGYHGRASSVVVSGQEVRRPNGQTRPDDQAPPIFGPSKQLDFELEMGFITFDGPELGNPIPIGKAQDHIFGLVLVNDWSARDIQKWEYVPLGPFLAKNFATSISAWVVTLDALAPFRVEAPEQDPPPLPYLHRTGPQGLDISLEVDIVPAGSTAATVCRSNSRYLYWSMEQQLAHHTVNGCNVRAGDLMASGTISGPTPDSAGSMLELAWKGTRPLAMPDGSERTFIHDGDTVVMRGFAQRDQVRIGFGELRATVQPAFP